jgi:3-phosphoshikimate 1-carboxyvinyltransferase
VVEVQLRRPCGRTPEGYRIVAGGEAKRRKGALLDTINNRILLSDFFIKGGLMEFLCEKAVLRGTAAIPGSKSHTIRAVAIAALADGASVITSPLESNDPTAAARVYGSLGACVEMAHGTWTIRGFSGKPAVPADVIDVANSGTTLNVALGSCSLLDAGAAVLTGDEQIRRRPSGALANALNNLGASVESTRGNGCAPFVVRGRLRGGATTLEAVSSQYLTSLLINCPLADGDTEINVPVLHEKPYVRITLEWLARQGIKLEHDEALTRFAIPGGQRYKAFERAIPGDFSSATFFLAAGALPGNDVTCEGVEMSDTQGDKAVVGYLERLGAVVEAGERSVRVRAHALNGCEIDLNATPDALPMLAGLACFAKGETRLVNVPQARIKETDRIAVMKLELGRLGARIEELADGLVIHESALYGAEVDGHGDHRVIMALAIIASAIPGTTVIRGAEAAAVTFPSFAQALENIGGKILRK